MQKYNKTEWVPEITLVSADNLNKVENQLETLTNESIALNSQLNNKTNEYIFNENALKKIRRLNYKRIVSIGDSIGAGSNATNNDGFFNQLNTSLKYNQGFFGEAINSFYYSNTGWNKEEEGICKMLLSSNDSSKSISLFPFGWHIPSLKDYSIQIVYSKRTTAGSFIVKREDGVLVDTISCQGANQDGVLSTTYTIPKGKNITITPSGNGTVYINQVIVDFDPDMSLKNRFENWSVGGRKAKDYTNKQLELMISYRPFDLLIWELFANDYSGGDINTYKERTEFIISLAKSKGMDVLIPITCGNSSSDATDESYENFRNVWVKFLYDMAIKYDCCIIDYDKKWSGYKNAKSNGLIADSIHPSYEGHTNMASDLCNVINGPNPCRYEKTDVYVCTGDTRKTPFGANASDKRQYFSNDTVFDKPYAITYDNNGNSQYSIMQPVIRTSNKAQLPKFAPLGSLATVGTNLYINTTDSKGKTTPATWIINSDYENIRTLYMNNNGQTTYKHLYPNVRINGSAQFPKYAPDSAICFIGRHMYVNTTDWGASKNIQAKWECVIADESRIEVLTSRPSNVNDEYLNRIFKYEQEGHDDQFITYTKTSNGSRKWVKFTTEDFNW